jgi:hypothetical protein
MVVLSVHGYKRTSVPYCHDGQKIEEVEGKESLPSSTAYLYAVYTIAAGKPQYYTPRAMAPSASFHLSPYQKAQLLGGAAPA